jgi:hypothetical protein
MVLGQPEQKSLQGPISKWRKAGCDSNMLIISTKQDGGPVSLSKKQDLSPKQPEQE